MSEAVLDVTSVRRWKRRETLQRMPFDWDVTIPADWKIHRLKEVVDARPSNVDKKSQEGERAVRLCNYVDVYKNDLITEAIEFMDATASDSQIEQFGIQAGDVIITKDSEAWDDIAVPAYVPKTIKNLVCGYHLTLIRPEAGVLDGAYLARCIQAEGIADQFRVMANGITRFGIGTQGIRCAAVPVPPLSEQRAITAFLDRETARIDALVAKKKRLIELLEEKRQAVICHAVTKGLDPNAVCAESGVEWIGEIPQHWTMPRVSSFCTVVRGASPRPAGDPQYFNGSDTPWITVAETTKDKAKYLTETSEYLTPEGKKLSRFLEVDTFILTNSGATLGVPKILRIAGCINDGSVAFLNIDERISKDFLYYYFTSQTNDIRIRMNRGMGQPNLNTDIVSKMPVPCPPPEEQVRIAAYLDDVTEVSHCQCVAISRSIDLLMEHRVALISAAVTGQIDVREEVQL